MLGHRNKSLVHRPAKRNLRFIPVPFDKSLTHKLFTINTSRYNVVTCPRGTIQVRISLMRSNPDKAKSRICPSTSPLNNVTPKILMSQNIIDWLYLKTFPNTHHRPTISTNSQRARMNLKHHPQSKKFSLETVRPHVTSTPLKGDFTILIDNWETKCSRKTMITIVDGTVNPKLWKSIHPVLWSSGRGFCCRMACSSVVGTSSMPCVAKQGWSSNTLAGLPMSFQTASHLTKWLMSSLTFPQKRQFGELVPPAW